MYYPARFVVLLLIFSSCTATAVAAVNAMGVDGFCAVISADDDNRTNGDNKPHGVDDEEPGCE